jgi:uncharacterized membrane protein
MSSQAPTAEAGLPPAPKPMYPDVPWWAVLMTALIVSIFSVIATAVVLRSGVNLPSGPTSMPSAAGLALDTMVYMPHIILLFGVLADMFTYDGVWSIPSLVGVLSIFVNFVFRYFWLGIDELWSTATKTFTKERAPVPTGGAKGTFGKEYDGCSVQGFESIRSEFAPQTLVVTATVFSYYCFDIIQNRGWVNSIAALAAFILTYIAQVAIIATTNSPLPGCEAPPNTTQYGAISQGVRALFEGILFGGTSYGIVKTYYPNRLPSSTVSPFPRRTAADLTLGPDGKMRDADGYPYVVLPNGQAVPDFGTAEARNQFGALVSENLGTGKPSKAGCPA